MFCWRKKKWGRALVLLQVQVGLRIGLSDYWLMEKLATSNSSIKYKHYVALQSLPKAKWRNKTAASFVLNNDFINHKMIPDPRINVNRYLSHLNLLTGWNLVKHLSLMKCINTLLVKRRAVPSSYEASCWPIFIFHISRFGILSAPLL